MIWKIAGINGNLMGFMAISWIFKLPKYGNLVGGIPTPLKNKIEEIKTPHLNGFYWSINEVFMEFNGDRIVI